MPPKTERNAVAGQSNAEWAKPCISGCDDLKTQLSRLYPTLAYLYDSCLQFLDRYNENSADARATIAFLAHGVREILNSIPDILGTRIASTRSSEEHALRSLRAELDKNESIVAPDGTTATVPISRTLAEALLQYRKCRELGATTASDRMAAVFLGDQNVRGGSLAAVKYAEDFFMELVHIDRSGTSSLPKRNKVLSEFALIEASIRSRLGDFFEAKNRIQAFLASANEIDESGTYRSPSREEVRQGLALTADQHLAHVFFGALENPLWLKELIELKALTNLSTPDTTGDWREYTYIVRMAPVVPDDVCVALSTASLSSPRLVKSAVLECAAQMPARNAAQLISHMLLWTGEDARLDDYVWRQEHLAQLFSSVFQNNDTQRVGKRLLQQLFCPRPDPSYDRDRPYYGSFYACVPLSIYEESLSTALKPLTLSAQIGVVRSFFHRMEAACFPEGTPSTSLTIPSIDEAVVGGDEELENQLVRVIYPMLREALSHNVGDNAERFEKALMDERHQLLQRCAMYTLTQALENCSPNDTQRLLLLADKAFSIPTILEGDYYPELFPLVRAVIKQDAKHSLDTFFSRFEETANESIDRWKQWVDGQGHNDALAAEAEAAMQQMTASELFHHLSNSHFSKQDIFDMKSHRGQGNVLSELFAEAPHAFGTLRTTPHHAATNIHCRDCARMVQCGIQ